MRLDKYLKVTGLAKRRTAAKDALNTGRIERDGKTVEPATMVRVGDELLIRYATRDLRVRVEAIPEGQTARRAAASFYTIVSEQRTD